MNNKAMGCIGKFVSAVGIVCYLVVAFGIIGCVEKGFTGEDVWGISFFVICGAFLRAGAKKMRKKASADTKPESDSVAKCKPMRGEPKVVQCPNCGANNTIYGSIGECEYCGSPLRLEGKK